MRYPAARLEAVNTDAGFAVGGVAKAEGVIGHKPLELNRGTEIVFSGKKNNRVGRCDRSRVDAHGHNKIPL